ncbi:MAG: hypothetical protein CMG60_08440 [Candidatus Marinimicrobia bacterium]|nr:hypothetical protein [Candidatus Neomarinimicrobiota bacterium]|tara:strand:- start:3233 stop:4654 length:1422 start_codon:yes stop_codon:yes gene_type:complete
MERKLTAIMFTDIVGYSRIMSTNERRGLELLDRQDELILPLIENFNGKILKRMGDAFFVDFSSSINAVECAVEIQKVLKGYNSNLEHEEKLLLRIGLHIGDVLIKGDDLFGEGINVAARLEPLADPGGICMSQAIYDSIKVKSDFEAVRVGDVSLKNILSKYTVYKIPSFYAEDYVEPVETSGVDEFQINYKIKNIKKLPPPSRGIISTSFIGISAFFSFTLAIIFFVFLTMDDDRIGKQEITNPEKLIQELKQPKNKASSYVKGLLYDEIKNLIDTLKVEGINDSIIIIIRKDINRLLLNGDIYYDNELIQSFKFSNKFKEKIKTYQLSKESVLEGRMILGQIFQGSIKEDPDSGFETFIIAAPSIFIEMIKNPMHYIVLILIILTYALTSIKITFEDIRDVDKVLGYFVEQMGFKKPIHLNKQLVYKPTLFQILVWGSSRIRARIDGNSIYLIGNIAIIKKLERMFKSYEV